MAPMEGLRGQWRVTSGFRLEVWVSDGNMGEDEGGTGAEEAKDVGRRHI